MSFCVCLECSADVSGTGAGRRHYDRTGHVAWTLLDRVPLPGEHWLCEEGYECLLPGDHKPSRRSAERAPDHE